MSADAAARRPYHGAFRLDLRDQKPDNWSERTGAFPGMSTEIKKEIQLELAHVLFIDIVGYSRLPINEQRALVERLNEIVRGAAEFQAAEAAGRLIKIPTGDGMALIFYQNPEAPVECALEIARAVKTHPELHLR